MDNCLVIIVYVDLGGHFFNKTSLVEKLELFLHLGLWLIVLIGFGLGFMYIVSCYEMFLLGCMWLVLMIFFAGVYVVSFDENFVRCCVCWVVRFGVQGLEDGQGLF